MSVNYHVYCGLPDMRIIRVALGGELAEIQRSITFSRKKWNVVLLVLL